MKVVYTIEKTPGLYTVWQRVRFRKSIIYQSTNLDDALKFLENKINKILFDKNFG